MTTFILLFIIYLSFISLGIHSSILGVSIPVMQGEWEFPLFFGGIVSMIIVGGKTIASFLSSLTIKKFGTARVALASCLVTAATLAGFSLSPSYIWLAALALPLGLSAGTLDVGLNNYVALHFKAHHMNWLHSSWGVGATLGPLIMSWYFAHTFSWRGGYNTVSLIQLFLAAVLFLSLPLWKKHQNITEIDETPKKTSDNHDLKKKTNNNSYGRIMSIPGVRYAFLTVFFYGAVELSMGLWGSSYLVKVKNMPIETGAFWMSFYYGGITAGRFLAGFFSFRFSNASLIRGGLVTASAGSFFLILPLSPVITGSAFILIGTGLAPVLPSMLHETPVRFGSEKTPDIIGYQMGFAFIGGALLPFLLGIVLQVTGMIFFPLFIILFVALMFYASERIDRITDRSNRV